MDAVQFLLKEHDKVRKTIADLLKGKHTEKTQLNIFNKLCADLVRHETMEHTVWYPHFKKNKDIYQTVKHLISEEKTAAKVIKQFKRIKTYAAWEKKFMGFQKDVKEHAGHEEKNLFPVAKKIFSEAELKKIGKDMSKFKRDYK